MAECGGEPWLFVAAVGVGNWWWWFIVGQKPLGFFCGPGNFVWRHGQREALTVAKPLGVV